MKILGAIIIPPHLSASGGARAGERLSEALVGHCDITIASMGPSMLAASGSARRAAVQVRLRAGGRCAPLRYRSLFYRSDIPALVRLGGYQLVHLHNPMPGLEMARVAAACRAAGVPYVISTHGFNEVANGEAVYGFGFARRLVWRACVAKPVAQAVRGAAAIFALSPADVPIVRQLGFSGDVVIVPNGVDPPEQGDPAQDALVCERFAIPARPEAPGITCMFLGNHTPNKGVPVLLEAFASLEIPFTLIVGGETRPDIPYGDYVGRARPGQRIVVTGRLTAREIDALFGRSDLFVFPTRADTFPLVVLEAMAHGVPVLASNVGGIPHQIDAGCGELVPPGNPQALRAAIERLAGDPLRLVAMREKARARAARFTWDAAAWCANEAYRQILGTACSVSVPRAA